MSIETRAGLLRLFGSTTWYTGPLGTATGIRQKGGFGSPKQDVGRKAACSREAD